jgi:hypothetical protein
MTPSWQWRVAHQVLPAESSSYGGIEQFTEMVEAAKWEVHFAATAASQEELGCLQARTCFLSSIRSIL